MADLKTDYKDDILVSGQQRKYNLIENSDGTVSLVDVSSYAQYGDTLKAEDFNATNAAVNALNGKKLLSKNVTIPITDQTIDANGTLRLVGSDGVYTTYDLLSSAEIGKGYKVMMVGNGTIRGNGVAINHIIPTYISFGDSALENLRLVNTHATGTAAPSAIILQVLAYTEGL